MATTEEAIEFMMVAGIIHIPEYSRIVIANIKSSLIENENLAECMDYIIDYHTKYSCLPTIEALEVYADSSKLPEERVNDIRTFINKIFTEKTVNMLVKQNVDWMIKTTEKRLRDRACFLTVMASLNIIDGTDKKLTPDAIPDMFREAISISFDTKFGHDYLEDADARFDFYHKSESVLPFSIKTLNFIMGGGAPKKAMIVFVAPTGVGKSTVLTSEAAWFLTQGKNVLYITLELAEERVAQRIDAKLFDVEVDSLKTMPKSAFDNKINRIKGKTNGKLIVQEYPAGTFNANHLRYQLSELKNKKGFVPDIVIGDYLGLFSSVRGSRTDNSYTLMKLTAEELRGVALEQDFLFLTAAQTNRSGQNAGDYDLNEVAESHGLSMTADAMFGMISTPELEQLKHIKFKQLKNRFGDMGVFNTWICGITRAKMSIYDLENTHTPVPNQNAGQSPITAKVDNKAAKSKFNFQ